MKVLLLLLPVVLCANLPVKKNILDQLHLHGAFDLNVLKCDIQIMIDALGGDPAEATCELECGKVISAGSVLFHSCPLICHGFQALVHQLHIHQDPTAATQCNTGARRSLLGNLHLLDAFQLSTLKCDIQIMLDVLGSDPTEQACEGECNKILKAGHILQFGCPLVCHGFQELVHHWHIHPDTTDGTTAQCTSTTSATKRFILDSLGFLGSAFHLDNLKCDLQLMMDVVGSDPTEMACENECHKLLSDGHVLNFGCPLVCKGFQSLVQHFHIVPDTTDPALSVCGAAQRLSTTSAAPAA